jgi:hypothetical protein
MGSLTVEKKGGGPAGYLGSLSGAALLRFLQTCSHVDLSVKGSAKSAASPSSTVGSQVFVIFPLSLLPCHELIPLLPCRLHPEQFGRFVDAYFSVFHLQASFASSLICLFSKCSTSSLRSTTSSTKLCSVLNSPISSLVPAEQRSFSSLFPAPALNADELSCRWNLLHATVLGLGSMCVVGEGDATEAVTLYEKATGAVNSAMFESASLTSVQAFVLLGNLAQKVRRLRAVSAFSLSSSVLMANKVDTPPLSAQSPLFRQRVPRRSSEDGDQPRPAFGGCRQGSFAV